MIRNLFMGSVLKTWMVVTIHPDFLITNFYNEFAMGLSTETIFLVTAIACRNLSQNLPRDDYHIFSKSSWL